MPEGVEVKISSELIKPLVQGKHIGKLFLGELGRYGVMRPVPEGYEEFLNSFRKLEDIGYVVSPVRIVDVQVKGKFMYWTFDNGWYMFSTFGMTGQWSPQEGKHMCLDMRLHDPDSHEISHVYFNDPRHFGTIKFTSSEKELKEKLGELGWDPLHQDRLTAPWLNWLKSELSRSNKPIGQTLLDQSLFAGVGNYIRAEALYQVGMSPWRTGKSLSREDLEKLCLAIVDVMEESYKYQGATLLTYKDAYGNEGRYSSCFKVYGRETDPLGNTIKKESTPDGRTIHWCPIIQT